MAYFTLEYEGRTLQMRPGQLSVANIAKTFRLIPDTIILVSERGTVAIPDGEDGIFSDIDSFDVWKVEGDKATGPRVSTAQLQGSGKWKPQSFPPPICAAGAASNRQVSTNYGTVCAWLSHYCINYEDLI